MTWLYYDCRNIGFGKLGLPKSSSAFFKFEKEKWIEKKTFSGVKIKKFPCYLPCWDPRCDHLIPLSQIIYGNA